MPNKFKYLILVFFTFIKLSSQEKWSLEDCIEHASNHNIHMIKKKIENRISTKNIKIARGNYLPTVNITTTQNFSLGNSFNVSTGVGQLESSSNSFYLSSSFNLFNGYENKHKLQKAKLLKEKSEVEIDKIQFDLKLNITQKYLQVLFNKEILKLIDGQLDISEQNYKRIQVLYDKGLVPKSELLDIKLTLTTESKEKTFAQNNLDNSLLELTELLDIKELKKFNIKYESIDDFFLLPIKKIEETINKNPEVKISKIDIKLKNKEILLSKADFYPTISLNYSFGSDYFHIIGEKDVVFNQETGQNQSNGFWTQLNNNRIHYVSISATIPVFNGYSIREKYNNSKEDLKISEFEIENKRQILKNRIEKARNDFNTTKSVFKACELALNIQKQAFEISQKQYNKGNLDSYKFLESKKNLGKINSDYIKSKYEYYFNGKILNYYYK